MCENCVKYLIREIQFGHLLVGARLCVELDDPSVSAWGKFREFRTNVATKSVSTLRSSWTPMARRIRRFSFLHFITTFLAEEAIRSAQTGRYRVGTACPQRAPVAAV